MAHVSLVPRTRRALLAGLLAGLTGSLLFAADASAQQFVVDDAGVTPPGSCRVDGWIGRAGGGVLPACSLLDRAEIALGASYADEPRGDRILRQVEYSAQARVGLRPDDPGALGVSLVAGLGSGPVDRVSGVQVGSVFAYLPLTWSRLDERAFFHLNAGWTYALDDAVHRPTYGFRGDLVLHHRLSVVGEVFGEGPDMEAQGGFRITLVRDLLMLDASYGAALAGSASGVGPALGLALTPGGFFRPLR